MKIYHAPTKRLRLEAAISHTDDDLLPDDNGRIAVTGVASNRVRYFLGDIAEETFYIDQTTTRMLIDRILFGTK